MKRASWWAVAVVLSVALRAVGQDVVEVPLAFKPFKDVKEMVNLSLGGVTTWLPSTPPKGYKAPPGTVKPKFFELSLEERTFVGMVAWSSPQAKTYDRLWVDWNNDKTFTGAEKLMGTATVRGKEKFVVFGPAKQSWEGRELECYFLVHDDSHIHLIPAGYWEGSITLGNRTVKLGLVDANTNGFLDDRLTASRSQEADVLLLDFDGNGAFDVAEEEPLLSGEVYYLTNLVQMPDGAFYRLKVAEGKPLVLLERDKSPTGKVKMASDRFQLLVAGQDGFLLVRGSDGEASLPVGSYQTHWVTVGKKDREGQMWAAVAGFYGSQPRFRVTKEKGADLPFGPPFKLVFTVEREKRTFEFSLSLEDRGGHELDGVYTPKMERPPEPVLVIADTKGKVVKTEKFHYG